MKPFQRIMVATDLLPTSAATVEEALDLARENGAELMIAHAYQPPNAAQAEAVVPGLSTEWDLNLRKSVEEKLQPFLAEAVNRGVKARVLVLKGAPDEAIVEAARNNNADLVIMGTHGRKGVARLFLGSVASRVVSTAPCPVMTIRAA